jgi:hypothetical protein
MPFNNFSVGQYIANNTTVTCVQEQAIGFTINGVKPNTRLSIFFDKINVTNKCAPATYSSNIKTLKSSDYHAVGNIGSPIVSDSTGKAIGIFYLAKNSFQTGNREFHVYNYISNTDTFSDMSANHTCEAFSYFRAFNHSNIDVDISSIISTIPSGSTSSVTLTNRGSGTATTADPNNPRFDPMCQSFYVGSDVTQGQDGLYLKSVDLYFSAVSSHHSVTIDIRTIENGLPTSTVLPYSRVTLPASSTVASSDASVATTFEFDTPIYLRSGYSYALSVIPGGGVPDYSVWTGVVGHTDTINGKVNSNWGQGTLFTSSTGSDWVPVHNQFLKFTMYRVDYNSLGSANFVNDDYEFITYANNSTIPFQVGEYVYQMPSPLAGYVSVNTTSNILSFNTSASGVLSTNLATAFAVNDHILVVGSVPPANTTNRIQNWGLFSNAVTLKITSINPTNNTLQFAYANGSTANGAPWTNSASVFFKPAKGTVSIISGSQNVVGTGTAFSQQFNTNIEDGTTKIPLVVNWSNTSTYGNEVLWPSSIANATFMTTRNAPFTTNTVAFPFALPTGQVSAIDPNRNLLIIKKSTANNNSSNTSWQNAFSTPSYFAPGRIISGTLSGATAVVSGIVDISMNSVQPIVYQTAIQGTDISYSANTINKQFAEVDYPKISISDTNYMTNNEIIIASRSNEINKNSGNKSVTFNASLSSASSLLTPSIDVGHLGLLVKSNIIGEDDAGEQTNYGTALSKSISKTITLADGMDAEDIQVYLTAYKPSGTNIKVYAKVLHASDTELFSEKGWSPLVQITDVTLYSDTTNQSDFKEYQYTFPTDPTCVPMPQLVTTNNSSVITSSNTTWEYVFSNGDFAVVYSDINKTSYEVHKISSVDSNTQITFSTPISFANTSSAVIGGMVNPQSAYKNSQNQNIVRYYTTSGVPYDSYKQFAIKIVMLSGNTASVPKVSDMRTLALSV